LLVSDRWEVLSVWKNVIYTLIHIYSALLKKGFNI
jgi:hypothetical protein